jgi:hypothetical protein
MFVALVPYVVFAICAPMTSVILMIKSTLVILGYVLRRTSYTGCRLLDFDHISSVV